MNEIKARVALNIRVGMLRKGATGKQLAETLALSEAAVSRRMSGAVAWNIDELDAVAALLDVSADQLLVDQAAAAAS